MADMAVSAFNGVMSSLLAKLGDEFKQLKRIRKDVESLHRDLAEINALLEKLASMENLDPQTKLWRDNVREMAYDTEDCIDIFVHQLGHGGDQDSFIGKVVRMIKELRARYQIAHKIQDLKARVAQQAESRRLFKLDESISPKPVVVKVDPHLVDKVDPRVPALYEEANRLVGIDVPVKEITQWLMEEADDDSALTRVVSIVGFGGLGKTTLAKQVFTQIKSKFDCTAFVSVSQKPDMLMILGDLLSKVDPSSTHIRGDHVKLIDALRQRLANKRYLIVIDDIWRTDAWDTIKCAFVQNNYSNGVITTTRNENVANCCCLHSHDKVHRMRPLNEADSRKLFFKRISVSKDDGYPEHCREISKDILRKCKGVPLAIISIASLLASQGMDIGRWELIKNSIGSELDKNPTLEWMSYVLTLSYNDLSPHMKTCLLYLGMYPEDSEIGKFELVNRWIAEGFVSEKKGLDMEDAAENCFNDLVNRSMIQPDAVDEATGDILSCRVHDLMLDLIIRKCAEENFITITDSPTEKRIFRVRRLSHQSNDGKLALQSMSLSQVRTFTIFFASNCMIMKSLLPKFELLRVLEIHINDTIEGIDLSAVSNKLFMLRYLRILHSGHWNVKLPSKIGKLQHLMTLHMTNEEIDMPSDVNCLSSLRHLIGSVGLPSGIGKLGALRTLRRLDLERCSLDSITGLREMTHLRELGVRYQNDCYWQVGVEDADAARLVFKTLAASLKQLGEKNLQTLRLDHCYPRPPNDFLSSCFSRPRRLRELHARYIPARSVPSWMVHATSLRDLVLCVEELRRVDVQLLAELPLLARLTLDAGTIQEESVIIRPKAFPSLRELQLPYKLSCLTIERGAMPELRDLTLECRINPATGGGAVQDEDGSPPVVGIEHLLSLQKVGIWPSYRHQDMDHLISRFNDAIYKHPKSHTIRFDTIARHSLVGGEPMITHLVYQFNGEADKFVFTGAWARVNV